MDFYYEHRDELAFHINVWKQPSIGINRHLHSSLEFIYIEKGEVYAEVGELSDTISQGKVIAIPSCVPHSLESTIPGNYIIFSIPCERLDLFGIDLRNKAFSNICVSDDENKTLLRLFSLMYEVDSMIGDNSYQYLLSHYANLIVFFVVKKNNLVPRERKLDNTSKAVEYIIHNLYNKDLSVKEISKALYCNQQKLSLEFRSVLQMSITEYITKLRLSKARELLFLKKGCKLEDIAFAVGFNNTRNFFRCYKNVYGCTPTETRISGNVEII